MVVRYERFVQYTSKWHKINLSKDNRQRQRDILQWCNERESDGKFHCICSYYQDDKGNIRERLIELRLTDIAFMEFALIGEFYE